VGEQLPPEIIAHWKEAEDPDDGVQMPIVNTSKAPCGGPPQFRTRHLQPPSIADAGRQIGARRDPRPVWRRTPARRRASVGSGTGDLPYLRSGRALYLI
jgi:hypothetical protein